MERKEVAEKVLDYIKSVGYKPYDIKYGTGYFVFDMGKDSVVHFKIKECPGWLFAMWIDTNEAELKDGTNEYPALRFFTQHNDNIDKFKPTRSFFLAEYKLRDIEKADEYTWYEIKGIVGMIKRHPIISHYFDRRQYCFSDKSFILSYLGAKWRGASRKLEVAWRDWMPIIWIKFKLLFCGKRKIIDKITIIDKNTEDFTCYPRWGVDILFNKNSTNAEECDYLNRWFKRVSNNVDLRLNRVGIDYSYDYTLNNDTRIPN